MEMESNSIYPWTKISITSVYCIAMRSMQFTMEHSFFSLYRPEPELEKSRRQQQKIVSKKKMLNTRNQWTILKESKWNGWSFLSTYCSLSSLLCCYWAPFRLMSSQIWSKAKGIRETMRTTTANDNCVKQKKNWNPSNHFNDIQIRFKHDSLES